MENHLISKKLLEDKLFRFCFPQKRVENKMKWNEVFIASKKIPERKGSILPYRFYGQLPDYQSHLLALSS